MQDLTSKVGGGEQQLSCSPETSSQLQRYEMARYREEGLEFGRSNSSNSLQQPIQNTHVEFCIYLYFKLSQPVSM